MACNRLAASTLLNDFVRKLCRDGRGSVAIMFALVMFLMFGFVGGAIDFVRIYRARTAFQSAIDAAVLAGARAKQLGATDQDAIAAAQSFVAPVRDKLTMNGTVDFTVTGAGSSFVGDANLSQPTMFLNVIGLSKLSFHASGVASFGVSLVGSGNVELVMMLDVTGSMAGQKIDELKSAASDLVDIVVANNQGSAYARVGIVPFSIAVKLDKNTFEAATGKKFTGAYKGCVVERTGADAYTDATPMGASVIVPLEDKVSGRPCDVGRDIVPLTDKKADLNALINGLQAGGSTAGHLGTAWAWYMLSPNWGTTIDQPNKPAPYSDLTTMLSNGEPKLKKIAVLMTDGAYNTQYSSVDSTTQARALCSQMKASGIIIYTVGFQLGGDATAIQTLQGCASDTSKFYDASTGDALKAAFRDIALKSIPLRLVQ